MTTLETIIKPVVTEKSTQQSAMFTYAFWVNRKATKIDVKMAVQDLYGVDVDTVRIMNTTSKDRAFRRGTIEKRPSMKKALVTLKGKKKLDPMKLSKDKDSKK